MSSDSKGSVSGRLTADSTTLQTWLVSPWMLLYGSSSVRIGAQLGGMTSLMRGAARWRTSDVRTDLPNAWSDSVNERSANGTYAEDADLSASTSALWVQVALGGRVSSAGVGEAEAVLRWSTKDLGVLVASRSVDVQPFVNSGEVAIVPLGRAPALSTAGVMGAFVVSGL